MAGRKTRKKLKGSEETERKDEKGRGPEGEVGGGV